MDENITPNILMERGEWEEYCDRKGWHYYVVNEGLIGGDEILEG